jgi:galactose mutarotase-like enzyme
MADFMNFPTPRERVLTYGNTTIGIIPEICLVSHFQVGSWQVLYRPTETGNIRRWGLPLMIPNFSRLKDGIFKEKGTTLPIHGFGRDLPWTVIEIDTTSPTGWAKPGRSLPFRSAETKSRGAASLQSGISPSLPVGIRSSTTHLAMQLSSSDATRPDYPYEFTFTATITAGEGTLTYTLLMENHSSEPMPIAPGFHPYFAVTQSEKANVVTGGPPGFDTHAFDWVQHIPDNSYPFPHEVTLQFPRRGTLTMSELPQDGSYALANMQVWSEPPTRPDHDFICFEPTVGSEDALNRPADRLNIATRSTGKIVLQLRAQPL